MGVPVLVGGNPPGLPVTGTILLRIIEEHKYPGDLMHAAAGAELLLRRRGTSCGDCLWRNPKQTPCRVPCENPQGKQTSTQDDTFKATTKSKPLTPANSVRGKEARNGKIIPRSRYLEPVGTCILRSLILHLV